MEFSRRQIIQALCNEYNHLFKDAYDPGIDLSFEEYQSAMEAKTLDELIKETSTDNEFYTLESFMKRYGWSKKVTSQIKVDAWSMRDELLSSGRQHRSWRLVQKSLALT